MLLGMERKHSKLRRIASLSDSEYQEVASEVSLFLVLTVLYVHSAVFTEQTRSKNATVTLSAWNCRTSDSGPDEEWPKEIEASRYPQMVPTATMMPFNAAIQDCARMGTTSCMRVRMPPCRGCIEMLRPYTHTKAFAINSVLRELSPKIPAKRAAMFGVHARPSIHTAVAMAPASMNGLRRFLPGPGS